MTGHRTSGFGWVITSDVSRTRYVQVDGNGEWCWVRDPRDAELFRTRAAAERFIFRNMAGASRAVEHNW